MCNCKKVERKMGIRVPNRVCILFVLMSFLCICTACEKKPIGGVNLEGVDIEEITSNETIVDAAADNDDAEVDETEAPDPNSFEGMEGVSIISVGDNIYHDNIIDSGVMEDGSYNYEHIYSKISSEIQAADISIVNQETVFCPEGSTPKGYPVFLTPNEAGDAMVKAGFDVFLMASNHTADNGKDAILHSINLLKGFEGIDYVGINENKEDEDILKIIEQDGIKIALLNYTELTNKALGNSDKYMLNRMTESRLKKDIKAAKEQADIVMVFPHWGTEYTHNVNSKQKNWTKVMSEAGADIVIGTHPHVIQPVEWVQSSTGHNTLVYYSLGNFVSRQIEGPRLLGGMAKIVLKKTDEGVKIGYASVVPLMMHYDQYPSLNTAIYRLEDYNEELAATHGVQYYESQGTYSHESILNLSNEIFGSASEIQIPFPEGY